MSQHFQSMLIFSLGPVQSFIMQARKTRDLWLGSYLLSKLMEAGMKDIDKLAEDFIFPTKRTIKEEDTGRDDIPDLPNKYIAIFKSSQDAQDAAKQSKKQIGDQWDQIRADVWQEIIQSNITLKSEDKEAAEKIWERQSNPDTFFEIFWVIVERKPDEKYKNWLDRAQKTLDARKRLRDFLPQPEAEQGEKSTISGEREALHGKGASRAEVRTFWTTLTTGLLAKGIAVKDIGQEGSERLDAIDTIKRFATESSPIPKQPFPSTSSIATASFVEQLLITPELKSVLEKWREATRGNLVQPPNTVKVIPYHELKARASPDEQSWILRRDGDCYFPETFTSARLKEDYRITDSNEAKHYLRALADFFKATDQLKTSDGRPRIAHPTPYYAIIQMDGDNMGTLLSEVQDKDEHKAISKKLSHFSRKEVPRLVENERPAKLVYAGGDDVVAFSPLKGLLDLVNELQNTYHDRLVDAVEGADRKKKVTASIGVAIAHHLTPLSFVLRAVREAEHLAKEHYGRDALVITAIRHSGEQTRVGCQWHYGNVTKDEKLVEDAQPIPLFSRFREFFEKDILSPKCIHILLDEASTLVWLERDAQASEIKRVLNRQRSDSKKDDLPDATIHYLAAHLSNLAAAMDWIIDKKHENDTEFKKSTELHSEEPRFGLIEVLGWLLVMAFLAGKEQD